MKTSKVSWILLAWFDCNPFETKENCVNLCSHIKPEKFMWNNECLNQVQAFVTLAIFFAHVKTEDIAI